MNFLILLCLALPAIATATRRQISPFIVGGSSASILNHPYQLSLRDSGLHKCGASLISATRAVTTAHCGGGALSLYTILGGTADRTVTSCSTCVTRSITGFNRHPNYNENSNTGFPNDIAVLIFSPISFNQYVNAVAMATTTDGSYSGASCVVTGWGRTCGTCALPDGLYQTTLTAITNPACLSAWGILKINDGHLCLSSADRTICTGDSGGPVVCGGKLAGAISWGDASCSPSFPAVASRISYFYAWITAQ